MRSLEHRTEQLEGAIQTDESEILVVWNESEIPDGSDRVIRLQWSDNDEKPRATS